MQNLCTDTNFGMSKSSYLEYVLSSIFISSPERAHSKFSLFFWTLLQDIVGCIMALLLIPVIFYYIKPSSSCLGYTAHWQRLPFFTQSHLSHWSLVCSLPPWASLPWMLQKPVKIHEDLSPMHCWSSLGNTKAARYGDLYLILYGCYKKMLWR